MNEQMQWQAVLARDVSADGRFFYGVITTGVYCKPSCPSRKPLRRNLRFYATAADAEHAGLRPCKRCRPDSTAADEPMAARMRALCRYIEAHADTALTLKDLSREAHLSPFHLQRRFKAVVGVTPKQYAEACRMRALKQGLRGAGSATDAIYAAGFGSPSRVYERIPTRIGMTPSEYGTGGEGVAISCAVAETPLGLLMVAATDRGLCFVQFDDSEPALRARLEAEYPGATITTMPAAGEGAFAQWMQALSEYLRGVRRQLDLPADIRGTAFQMKVWDYLREIPCSEVRTYKEVAAAIGHPTAVRAVGSACGANPVSLAIPCHRVIRGDGGLGGYRWGLERKRALIDIERTAAAEDRA